MIKFLRAWGLVKAIDAVVSRFDRRKVVVPDKCAPRVKGCAGCAEGHDHEEFPPLPANAVSEQRPESAASQMEDVERCDTCKQPIDSNAHIRYWGGLTRCLECEQRLRIAT